MEIEHKETKKEITMNVIQWLSRGGCNPFDTSFKKQIIAYIYITLSVINVILLIPNFIYTHHSSVSNLVEDSIMLLGFTQIGAKYYAAIQKSEFIAKMLETLWNQFWTTETFNKKFQTKVMRAYKGAKYLGNIYAFVVISAGLLFIFQVANKSERSLVIEIWIPHKEILKISPYYEILYIAQSFFLLSGVWFSVIQLDRLFVLLTCFIWVQQRMVQIEISNINKANSKYENFHILRKCVVHHNLLFKFLGDFETVFSRLFLPTLATNFCLISLTMYGMIMEDSINRKMTSAFVYLSILFQLFAYCYAGHLIQEEGMKIGESAYNNGWYELDEHSTKMGLLLVNLRSQRKIELTVGGLMVLSMENFAAVVRASFTFMTFIANSRT